MIWKITLSSNETHTLPTPPKDYEDLVSLVQLKYNLKNPDHFSLKYIDTDDEFITLSGNEDFDTAILSCNQEHVQALEVFVFPATAVQQIQKDFLASLNMSLLNKDKGWPTFQKSQSMQVGEKRNQLKSSAAEKFLKEKSGKSGKSKRSVSCILLGKEKMSDQEGKENKRKGSEILKRAVDEIDKQVQVEIIEILPEVIGAIKNVLEPSKLDKNQSQTQSTGKSFAKDVLDPKEPEKENKKRFPVCSIQHMIATKLEKNLSHRTNALQDIPEEPAKDPSTEDFVRPNRPRAGTFVGKTKQEVTMALPALCKNFSVNPSAYLNVRRNCQLKDICDYKVSLSRINSDEPIKAEPMGCYRVAFELKNCGDTKLPEKVRLVCINGVNKGNEKMIPSLEPGRAITTELLLKAPSKSGKYSSQWRISYGKGDNQRSIGESVFEEVCVGSSACTSPESAKKKTNNQSVDCQPGGAWQDVVISQRCYSKPDEICELPGLLSLKKGQSTVVTREEKVKCAKFLNEVFPGNLREKMNFVREISEGVTISGAVERYLMMPKATKY